MCACVHTDRDCIDVDVLPDHKRVPPTLRGIYGFPIPGPVNYVKTDHCQYTPGYYDIAANSPEVGGATCFAIPPAGEQNSQKQTTEEALAACQSRCTHTGMLYHPYVTFNPLTISGGAFIGGHCAAHVCIAV